MKNDERTNIFAIDRLGTWLIVLSFVIAPIAFWVTVSLPENIWVKLVKDFYPNVVTDLLSIGLGIKVLDKLYQKRNNESEKRNLVSQLGSSFNLFALDAARILRHKEWHNNLESTSFYRANLKNAELYDFNLKKANLTYANLKNANLNGTILDGADITETILEKAQFCRASLKNVIIRSGEETLRSGVEIFILKDAEFIETDLTGATFLGIFDGIMTESYHPHLMAASRLQRSTMPNGRRYNGCYNLRGDLETAIAYRYDLSNPFAIAEFYDVSVDEYMQGQLWKIAYDKYWQSRAAKGRELCIEQGWDWDNMSENERGKFLDIWYKEP